MYEAMEMEWMHVGWGDIGCSWTSLNKQRSDAKQMDEYFEKLENEENGRECRDDEMGGAQ